MKLFEKYNRLNLAMMVVVFLLSSIAYYFLLRAVLINELDEDLLDKKVQLPSIIDQNNKLTYDSRLEEMIITITPDSTVISKPKLAYAEHFDSEENENALFRELTYTQRINGKNVKITIAKALETTSTLLSIIIGITLAIILLVVITSIILNRVLLKRLWKPFYGTVEAVRNFKISDNNALFLPQSDIEEFTILNKSLSTTIDGAQREYVLLKEFTENASHELQTPLAILRSKLDIAIQSNDLTEEHSIMLSQMYGPIKKLSRLSSSLLLLTKIENNQFKDKQEINLKAKLEEKVQEFSELWENKEISISIKMSDASLYANPELIDILVNNLLSNATKHNLPGGQINIELTPAFLRISNSGLDTALDAERIFQRFYKGDAGKEGLGLGLAIIWEICRETVIDIRYSFSAELHHFILEFHS